MNRLKAGETTVTFDNRYRGKDGAYHWLRWTAYLEAGLLYSVAHDITSFRDAEDRFQLVLESSPIALVCSSAEGKIYLLNRAMETLSGYDRSELIGQPIEILVPEDRREGHRALCEEYSADPHERPMGRGRDLVVRRKDGTELPAEIALNPMKGSDDPLVLAAIVDLTGRKEIEERFRSQTAEFARINANYAALVSEDGLTGLKNRKYFFEDMERYLRAASRGGTPLSVIMLDVDQFKSFNDTFGRQYGDEALRGVASILRGAVRWTDTVARYGGDQFVIALPETNKEGAIQAAERYRRAIEQGPWTQRDVTTSFGAATAEAASIDWSHVTYCMELIIGRADQALYSSKQNGRNRATHIEEMGQ